MTKKNKSHVKFVGLHAHSNASIFDGLGYPGEHMDFAFETGQDALALTDHGNMNNLAYQVTHAKKMQKDGKDFKPVFGCEAYFLPSISKWKQEVDALKEKRNEEIGTFVEEETRGEKKDLLRRRSHLILLAQNQTGLNNLFKLVSESFKEGNFYRYPRMDYRLLKEYGEGIIASSACLGGVYAQDYWRNRDDGPDAVMQAMYKTTQQMQEVFGDRWYGEIQWNRIPEQHELNQYIIKTCQKMGVDLISTADSHFPSQDTFKDRELYRRLGWIGKARRPEWLDIDLPASLDDMDYELYPKNGDAMWESYKKFAD